MFTVDLCLPGLQCRISERLPPHPEPANSFCFETAEVAGLSHAMKQFASHIANPNSFDGTVRRKCPSFWRAGRERFDAYPYFESSCQMIGLLFLDPSE